MKTIQSAVKQSEVESGPWRLAKFILQPRVVLAVGVLLCLADVVLLAHTISNLDYAIVNGDFGAFLKAARLVTNGQNLYDPKYWTPAAFWYGTSAVRDQYPYPVFFAEFTAVLSVPGGVFAYLVWAVVSIASVCGSLILALRHFGFRTPWHWVILIIGIFFSSYSSRTEMYHGQTNYVLLGLLTLGLWLYGKGRSRGTGILWGLMIAVKPFLGVLIVYLLWKRSWRAAFSCIATAAGVTIVTFALTFGSAINDIKGYLAVSSYYGNAPYAARPDDQSIHGFLLRLFVNNPFTFPWANSPLLVTLISLVLAVALVGAFLLAVPAVDLRQGPLEGNGPNPELLVESGLVLALCFAYGPFIENDHLNLLIPGLIGILVLAYRRWQQRAATTGWWVASAALMSLALVHLVLPINIVVGQATGENWTQTGGPGLLWTGQIGVPLLASGLTLATALWLERRPSLGTNLSITSPRTWRTVLADWLPDSWRATLAGRIAPMLAAGRSPFA